MIEEVGRVAAVDEQHIWIETEIKTTCSACQANDNCGTGTIAKAFSPKTETLKLPRFQNVKVGQQVKLGIPEKSLLSASALVYMLPLLVMVISAVLGPFLLAQLALEHELFVVAFTLLTTSASFAWVRHHISQQAPERYQPRLLEVLPVSDIQFIELK